MKRRARSTGGVYAAPYRERVPGGWGQDYFPISAKSGRAVAQSTAERDYANEHGAVESPGLWDSDTERATHGPRKVPMTEPRPDEAAMAEYVARRGPTMTAHQWEVYTLFWVQRLSRTTIASRLGRKAERIYECIKHLRQRARAIGQ